MKKVFAIAAVLTIACSVRADSYLYWMLEDSPVEFTYAKLLAEDENGTTICYLAMGNTSRDAVASADSTSVNPIYSKLPLSYDLTQLRFLVELYSSEKQVVGVSSYASYLGLQKFIYDDMSTTGIIPYHFTAMIPEPSGGLLVIFGAGLMVLRRKKLKCEVEERNCNRRKQIHRRALASM